MAIFHFTMVTMQASIFGTIAEKPKKRGKKKRVLTSRVIPAYEPESKIHGSRVEGGMADIGEPVEKTFTVSEFLDFVNEVFKKEEIVITGEITGFQHHPSGAYFSLKDKEDESILNCYMNPYAYRTSGIDLEDGMEVKVGGRPNIYKPKGKFSFVVQTIELVGEGALKKAYEILKKKLEAEGLFDRKRSIPEFVTRVALITSKTGAVIGDFRKNIVPLGLTLSLIDVRVEGMRAAEEIVRAIHTINARADDFDVLVVMRGGGSLEDLQAFNSESVARAIFASKIPTICAIGHDRDVPIASLVGDKAPSTPTAAAVLVNATWDRLRLELPTFERRLIFGFEQMLRAIESTITHSINLLVGKLRELLMSYMNLSRRIFERFSETLRRAVETVTHAEKYLLAVSPERNLKLGYSILTNKNKKVIRRATDLKVGDDIVAQLHEGSVEGKVTRVLGSS